MLFGYYLHLHRNTDPKVPIIVVYFVSIIAEKFCATLGL